MRRLSQYLVLALCSAPLTGWAGTPISSTPLSELLMADLHSVPATLVSDNSPALSAEISARIDHIAVRVGDRVERGETLVELDCRHHRAQLAASRAQLQQLSAQQRFAADQLKRARDLKRKQSISDELLEQRQSELDSLLAQAKAQQAQIEQTALQVEHCTITAPINGVVTQRLTSVGSLAAPGTPLLQLTELDHLEVSAHLREDEAAGLAEAMEFWFEYQGSRTPARLRQLLPVVDSRTRSREARLSLESHALPAGAAGRLFWQSGRSLIPADYLVRRNDRLGVFYLNDGKAHFHPLPDALEGQPAVIDLPADTRIIVEGRYGLKTGDTVEHTQDR